MTFIPKKNKKAQNISLVLILMGIAVFALSGYVSYAAFFQIIAIGVIVAGVQLLVRYALTDYAYIIDDREDGGADFVVIRKQGKREIKVCHISLFAVTDTFRRGEKTVDSRKRFGYVQNLGAEPYVIVYCDGDSLTEVLIEADEKFISAIRERMGRDGGGEQNSFAM